VTQQGLGLGSKVGNVGLDLGSKVGSVGFDLGNKVGSVGFDLGNKLGNVTTFSTGLWGSMQDSLGRTSSPTSGQMTSSPALPEQPAEGKLGASDENAREAAQDLETTLTTEVVSTPGHDYVKDTSVHEDAAQESETSLTTEFASMQAHDCVKDKILHAEHAAPVVADHACTDMHLHQHVADSVHSNRTPEVPADPAPALQPEFDDVFDACPGVANTEGWNSTSEITGEGAHTEQTSVNVNAGVEQDLTALDMQDSGDGGMEDDLEGMFGSDWTEVQPQADTMPTSMTDLSHASAANASEHEEPPPTRIDTAREITKPCDPIQDVSAPEPDISNPEQVWPASLPSTSSPMETSTVASNPSRDVNLQGTNKSASMQIPHNTTPVVDTGCSVGGTNGKDSAVPKWR